MANTIMSAKNSFQEGLIMDFSPDNTQATCMTSALNATLLTFNGNEMLLLNDMGNGRVETAYLPEGYMPVGTCEFGDIIYIVSYNPIINKSLIGCFPSPERNISSEEVGKLNQSLAANEFLYYDGRTGLPSGQLKANSVKKIIFEKSLNPGDKYIVYSNPELLNNYEKLTDFGNTNHIYSDWPKLLKLHVVAIEDSGKINYLDTDVRWYTNIYKAPDPSTPGGGDDGGGDDGGGGGGGGGGSEDPEEEGIPVIDPNARPMRFMRMAPRTLGNAATFARAIEGSNDYFILLLSDNSLGNPDIDSYRSLVSSAYSVFLSKVSGKLAILAELEKISGFSCTNNVYVDNNGNYKVYLNSSWNTDNFNINPSGFVVTDSQWSNMGNISYPTNLVETKELPEKFRFTSEYDLANSTTYEDFVNNTCYDALVKTFESKYKSKGDLNYMPRKVTLMLENGIPAILGTPLNASYYVNAFAMKDNKVVFYDKSGGAQDSYKYPDTSVGNPYLTDTFVHNYFGKDITKLFYTIAPNNGVHQYTICPAMPYGYLEEFSVTDSIDFSKVGTGHIGLNEWRYYNDGEVGTLTFGFEAYPEQNKGISMVALEFYDNQGLAAVLHLDNKTSYSGTFTEVFQFNSSANRRINDKDMDGIKFTHRGDGPYELPVDATADDRETMQEMVKDGVYLKDSDGYWVNDAGILYPNILYHVVIKVCYQHKNVFGEYDTNDINREIKEFHRWYWSNNMFNQYYHNTTDFDNLKLDLNLTLQSAFQGTNDLSTNNEKLINNSVPESYNPDIPALYLSLGYNKYTIGSANSNGNVKLGLVPSLENSYNTFTLLPTVYDVLQYKIWEGDLKIEIPNDITLNSSKNSPFIKYSEIMLPMAGTTGAGSRPNPTDSVNAFLNWANSLKEWFTLDIKNSQSGIETIDYVSYNGEVKNLSGAPYYQINASDAKPDLGTNNLNLLLKGESYSKIMTNLARPETIDCIEYRPFIQNMNDLKKYNITKANVSGQYGFAFEKIYNISMSGKHGKASCFYGLTSTDGTINVGETHDTFGLTITGNLTGNSKVKLSITDCMEANSVDIGPFGLLSVVTRSGVDGTENNTESEGHVMKCRMLANKDFNPSLETININWRNLWGGYCVNDEEGNKDIASYILGLNSARDYKTTNSGARGKGAFTFLFVAKDETGRYVPFNAFSRCYTTSTGLATQRFAKAPGYNDNIGLPYTSFAHIIASYLCQLYYKSDQTILKDILIFDDIIINNSYNIEWRKEFIIKCVTKSNYDIKTCIGILGIPYDDYLNQYTKYGFDISGSNVTINKEELEERAILVEFVHSIPYDILELLSIYNITLYEKPTYISLDITGKYLGGFVNDTIPGSEIIALDLGNNKLVDYNLIDAALVLKFLTFDDNTLAWDPLFTSNEYDTFKLSDLAKLLTIKDGAAVLKMLAVPNSTFKLSYSSDDDLHNEGEQLALGYDGNKKLHKVFEI